MQPAPIPVFKGLADPTRRAIFERLTIQGEQTVHALTDQFGVSQPAISKHLGVLKRAGLVTNTRTGRETRYTALPGGLAPLVDWMRMYGAFWNKHIDSLEQLLNRID